MLKIKKIHGQEEFSQRHITSVISNPSKLYKFPEHGFPMGLSVVVNFLIKKIKILKQ